MVTLFPYILRQTKVPLSHLCEQWITQLCSCNQLQGVLVIHTHRKQQASVFSQKNNWPPANGRQKLVELVDGQMIYTYSEEEKVETKTELKVEDLQSWVYRDTIQTKITAFTSQVAVPELWN